MTTANNELLRFFFEDVADTMSGIDERLHYLKSARNHEEAAPQMEALGVLAHRLRGTAGLYGFPQMAQLASVAERLLMPRPRLNPELQGTYTEVMEDIAAALRGAIKQAEATGREGNLGLTFAQSGAAQKMSELLRTQPGAFHLARGHLRGQTADLDTALGSAGPEPAAAGTPAQAPATAIQGQVGGDRLSQQLHDFARDNAEVWEYFAPEVQEHLDALQLGLGAAEPDVAALFRSAHTIKGSSYMVGLQPLGDFAHRMEDLLGAVRDGRQELAGPAADTLELASDLIGQMLQAAGGQNVALDEPVDRLATRLQLLAGGHDWTEVVARETQRAAAQQAQQAQQAAQVLPTETAQPVSNLHSELAAFGRENAEVLEYFAPEVHEHLDALRAQLERADAADINELFRSAHTIKGSAYMVGLQPLGDFAHRLEDLFGAVRDGAQALSSPVLETIDHAVDVLARMLALTQDQDTAAPQDTAVAQDAAQLGERLQLLALGRSLDSILESERAAAETAGTAPAETAPQAAPSSAALLAARTSVRVDTRRLENLMDQVGDLVVSRARLEQALSQFAALQGALDQSQARFSRTVRDFEERYLNPDMVSAGTADTGRAAVLGTDLSEQFDELEFDTYNDLNILARSMTELAADFSEVRSRFEQGLRALQEESEDLGKLTRRLRLDLSRTSRVPFSGTASRLRRWAREREDRLRLTIEGESTEVDTAVLQQLAEPLLHLLNNAASHGIASPEVRRAAGKPELGQVTVRVGEVGNFLEVTVEDDGQGLDHGAIRVRALEKGLRSAQELDGMSPADIARLILLPGLSTAQTVSAEAGRGVGMDVVASTLRQMGGDLLIQTEPGQGTAFTMRIPTNQRITDLLTCRVGESEVAFSVGTVRVLLEHRAGELLSGEGGPELLLDGERLPVIDLRRIWGVEEPSDTYSLVVLNSVTGDVAVRVDAFGEIDEAAVGALGGVLAQLDYLSGTAISAGGQPMPIIDPAGVARLARRREAWLRPESRSAAEIRRAARVLLVDDSLSVRRLVSRMLERGGYEVVTANDGQEALDLLQLDTRFDLVISDLEMPRMNGYELLSALRGRPATAALPLVVMTTRAGEKHQRLAFQLGANDYFSKPVDEALLLRRLGSMLGDA
ncbi:CheA signal transduction histidine kinase (plasmid) [Deinococcus proteolyticus MRP]|uniref:histidine kinase n=1 Tax=Deinococcus proteolyticus (strain ATCC 35074 / DSM 20540 / JCM 6276 / NBRC 101906 / NCIMB 13154 / VKM Ac-1939 / CCM 2703 / MRP) TaxID=693977 RepID=F0RPT7_DEIPM|nr:MULTISPECIES: Hpt domain-containing protein [Deinococcus]ADY27393.1 CheA signal transduction histidine kinase [Deinococcus proteolyticus MRP]MCY1704268.1 Hpt domain-containing protein [Deinococcus sp. SL84]